MDRQLLHKIEGNLWTVLEDYAKGFKSPTEVETVKHALSGIFKIQCMEEMDEFKGGSYRGGRSMDGGSRDGRSYRYYDEGSFANRSRDGSYRGGSYAYSRDGSMMKEKLQHLMMEAQDDRQRQVIQEMMNRL